MLFEVHTAFAGDVKTEKVTLVGTRIVEFVPEGYDASRTPSLMLVREPKKIGEVPLNWTLISQFTSVDGKANASLNVPAGTSLYGGGEVTGPLLRNGQKIKLWNTDNGMYRVDGGSRLYQTHPWVLGVRPDGTAFGVLFDSFWKAELITNSDKIEFNTEGAPFRTYVIDRKTPQEVLKGLAELTGTISMPPRWSLGYHQSRFSYVPEARVKEVADTFREKKIPCDVIWFDINYMDEFRVFTINNRDFPDPKRMNDYLHGNGFRSVYMIDPGVKVDENYYVYKTGKEQDVFVRDAYRNEFHGKVWPGDCAFPDFTRPETRTWWAGLYKDFLANGIDGIWNDMNEPAIFYTEDHLKEVFEKIHEYENQNLDINTFFEFKALLDSIALSTDDFKRFYHEVNGKMIRHDKVHNLYGYNMTRAAGEAFERLVPDRRILMFSRSSFVGMHRYGGV